MSAVEALEVARATGIKLRVDGDDLMLEAPAAPPAAVLDLLSRHKGTIVALLRVSGASMAPWTATDWREYFEERVAIAMIDGRQPEAEARRIARASCITRWRELNPGADDPSICAHCGKADAPGNIVPFGTGPHVWLHDRCWAPWDRARREEAIQALRKLLGAATHG